MPDLIAVRHYQNYIEANIALGRLKDAGIDCVLTDENTVQLYWLYSDAIGGIRLLVREEDLQAALQILDDTSGNLFDEKGT